MPADEEGERQICRELEGSGQQNGAARPSGSQPEPNDLWRERDDPQPPLLSILTRARKNAPAATDDTYYAVRAPRSVG